MAGRHVGIATMDSVTQVSLEEKQKRHETNARHLELLDLYCKNIEGEEVNWRETWEELYKSIYPILVRCILRRTKDEGDAHDLAQEVLLRYLASPAVAVTVQAKVRTSLVFFLYWKARAVISAKIRSRTREEKALADRPAPTQISEDAATEKMQESEKKLACLSGCLGCLRDDELKVIGLLVIEPKPTIAEIALRLGTNDGRVNGLKARAIKRLSKCMKEHGF